MLRGRDTNNFLSRGIWSRLKKNEIVWHWRKFLKSYYDLISNFVQFLNLFFRASILRGDGSYFITSQFMKELFTTRSILHFRFIQ